MLKKNRGKIILSSAIILLPAVFGMIMWNELPGMMATHWGFDGNADGFGSKAFAVFGIPVILLVLHLFCLLVTSLDRMQREQNQKALGMVFWIMPATSLFASGTIYCAAFGKELEFTVLLPALLGVMFILIGNYLPKVKRNKTLGIRISWALNNEENWNATHRFAGKLWVAGGLALLLLAFLPLKAMVWGAVCVIAAMVILPVFYSHSVYRRHRREGIVYAKAASEGGQRAAAVTASVITLIILIGVAVLMFTGSIEVRCEDTALSISATYWSDLQIDYSGIDTAEYRDDLDVGVRTYGFGSARLSMGIFHNDEFGSYTLYSYTGAKEHIVLTSGDKTLAIGMDDAGETAAIYDALIEKLSRY